MKRLKKVMFFLGSMFIIYSNVININNKKNIIITDTDLIEVLGKAAFFSFKNESPLHYNAFITDKKNNRIGVGFLTTDISPKINGYSDEITILLSMDYMGFIKGLKLIDHSETPSYMYTILSSKLFDSIIEKNIKDDFSNIETITGATVSSKAIIDDIQSSSKKIAKEVFNIKIKESKTINLFNNPENILFIVVLLIFLLTYYKKNNKILRNISVCFSIFLIGAYFNTFITLTNITNILNLKFIPISNIKLFSLIVFTLVTTPLAGVIYCELICPLGTLQELTFKIFPKKWQISGTLNRHLKNIKYFILFFCIFMIFGLSFKSFSHLEPFEYLFSWLHNSDIGIMWLYIIIIIISSSYRRFYCRIFCPTGACLKILKKTVKLIKQLK